MSVAAVAHEMRPRDAGAASRPNGRRVALDRLLDERERMLGDYATLREEIESLRHFEREARLRAAEVAGTREAWRRSEERVEALEKENAVLRATLAALETRR